jgi:hypothetical protein
MADRYQHLTGFEFSGVSVRSPQIIGFPAQKGPFDDPLEQRNTAAFWYYPQKPPEKQWAVRYLGNATGAHLCAAFKPNERWVCVTEDGEVCVVGQGDNEWESPIIKKPNVYFSNVKSVRKGHAIAVGIRRKVFLRTAPNRWVQLDTGLFPQGEQTDLENAGFSDIDGFSEEDMYACGGKADLWHYHGKLWTRIDLPTNAVLKNLCCADDGNVYITTNRKEVIKGRDATWEVIEQEETTDVLESIVSYDGKVLIATVPAIFTVEGTVFKPASLGEPDMKSKAHLAAGNGILVVAGSDEAALYDGKAWSVILAPE